MQIIEKDATIAQELEIERWENIFPAKKLLVLALFSVTATTTTVIGFEGIETCKIYGGKSDWKINRHSVRPIAAILLGFFYQLLATANTYYLD